MNIKYYTIITVKRIILDKSGDQMQFVM